MEWHWVKMELERARRLYAVATPGILSPETSVYVARQPGWILIVYQSVLPEYVGDRKAFIWRARRDAEGVAAILRPRSIGKGLDSIGAADDLRSAKIHAETEAFRMAR